jgi:chromosome segregation ATPase
MMTTATNKDLQQLKDLITAGNAATQKQIADLANTTQKQISDLGTNMQRQITDLTLEMKESYAQSDKKIDQLDKKIDTSFTDLKGQINNAESKLEGKIAVCNSKLVGLESTAAKLPDLAEKVGELKNWKQIAIVIFTASVSGAIAWFIRSGQP